MLSIAGDINLRLVAVRAVRILAISWVAIFAIVYFSQRQLMYLPTGGGTPLPYRQLVGVEVGQLKAPDGVDLTIWSAPAKPGKPTVVYFHGNGGSLNHCADHFRRFMSEGWGFHAFSYRSFSGSGGRPSETANVSDAILAYDSLRARGIVAEDIVLFGQSLGSGVAVQVAAQRPAAALILETPYSSVTDVAADAYWYLPVRLVIADRYESTTHIQKISVPTLILHGTRDDVIGVKFGRKLAAATPEPKRYVEYPDGDHFNLFEQGAWDDVKAWIAQYHRRARGN